MDHRRTETTFGIGSHRSTNLPLGRLAYPQFAARPDRSQQRAYRREPNRDTTQIRFLEHQKSLAS